MIFNRGRLMQRHLWTIMDMVNLDVWIQIVGWLVNDEGDEFPAEPTQWNDRDLDGYGDNPTSGAALIEILSFPETRRSGIERTDGDGHLATIRMEHWGPDDGFQTKILKD